jgi:molybdate transport system substrate-binding protein
MKLRLLSGGAAQALVNSLAAQFKAETGFDIDGSFGAVGAMKARLLEGDPADLLILTRALIDGLAADGEVDPASIADLGPVRTAIAVRAGDPAPAVSDARALGEALRAADAIYFPDPKLATAGIHFAKVLAALGLAADAAGRLRTFPNGATAMRELAASRDARPIGCTQVTEILATPGVALIDLLPPEFELATTYTIGVTTRAANPDPARRLAAMLTSPKAAEIRHQVGIGR